MIKLLLSSHAQRIWGERIAAAVPPGTLSLLTAEEALAAEGPSAAMPGSRAWPSVRHATWPASVR